jgi:hypothetical protein
VAARVVRLGDLAERDSAAGRAGAGLVLAVVRDVDRPEAPVAGAAVALRPVRGGPAAAGAVTCADGVARLPPVAAGEYLAVVRRIGYRPDSARVAVAPGCVARLEAYVSPFPNSLFPLALTRARFTLSTCAPGA